MDIEEALKVRMRELNIREGDIEEKFVTSSGPGGQNVNKVATCVMLHHIPTGIMVKCQNERSQSLNRIRARWNLVSKIEFKIKQDEARKIKEKELNKRRNRKRPGNLKELILEKKHIRSDKKQARRKISLKDLE